MEIGVLLKIAGIGLLTAVISQVLSRAGREEVATLTTVAGIVIVLIMLVSLLGELVDQVKAVFSLS